MVKRINISIPDELYNRIQKTKQGFIKDLSISKICQTAIEESLDDAVARAFVWQYGFDDGVKYAQSLSAEEQRSVKKMVLSFPRKHPDDITGLLMKVGLINADNLQKHLEVVEHWKSAFKRFEFLEFVDDSFWDEEGNVDLWEWGGRPAVHDGEEIYDISAEIRWNKIQEIWRTGLLAGIKDAIKTIEVADDKNE